MEQKKIKAFSARKAVSTEKQISSGFKKISIRWSFLPIRSDLGSSFDWQEEKFPSQAFVVLGSCDHKPMVYPRKYQTKN